MGREGWRAGSAVQRKSSSCRGLGFGSQHAQLVTLAGESKASGLHGQRILVYWHTCTHKSDNKSLIKSRRMGTGEVALSLKPYDQGSIPRSQMGKTQMQWCASVIPALRGVMGMEAGRMDKGTYMQISGRNVRKGPDSKQKQQPQQQNKKWRGAPTPPKSSGLIHAVLCTRVAHTRTYTHTCVHTWQN